MSNHVSFTPEGLARLAAIVRAARGDLSYEKFQHKTGVSHATIWKIEMAARPNYEPKIRQLMFSTLAALAPHLGYKVEQLIAICRGESEIIVENDEPITMADDVWEFVMRLPPSEIQRLRTMLIEKLPLSPKEISQILKSLSNTLDA